MPEKDIPKWGGNFQEATVGQVQYAGTFFDLSGKKEKKEVQKNVSATEYTYNSNTYSGTPNKQTGWGDADDGTHKYPPRKPATTRPPAAAYEWDDAGAYRYGGGGGGYYWDGCGGGGHPPPRAVDYWDGCGGAQEKPPTQLGPPREVNKKLEECKPLGQEPLPDAKKEPEAMLPLQPKASPKQHGEGEPPAAIIPAPRKQPPYGGHPAHPGWAAGYPPQHAEGGGGYYYGHGGGGGGGYGYPPAQGRVYLPYQGRGQGGGYGGGGYGGTYGGAYMGWSAPAPPAGAYPPPVYGAYHKHHGGYGGGGYGYGGGGYGYGGGKYRIGHEGKFKQYAYRQGKF